MAIKGIIFDKDGTLFDFQKSWGHSTYEFLRILSEGKSKKLMKLSQILKFDLDKKVFLKKSPFIAGTVYQTAEIIHKVLPEKKISDILAIQKDHYSDLTQIPVRDLHKTLEALRAKGYRLAVATNDLEDLSILQLSKEKILHNFDLVLGSDSGFGAKPNPGQLIEISKSLMIPCTEFLMVGDSIEDLQAAQRACIKPVGVLTGVATKPDLRAHSSTILKDIAMLELWLESHKKSLKT